MILRVVDENGSVLHDCALAGCEVSWDGVEIATGVPVQGGSAGALPLTALGSDLVQLQTDADAVTP